MGAAGEGGEGVRGCEEEGLAGGSVVVGVDLDLGFGGGGRGGRHVKVVVTWEVGGVWVSVVSVVCFVLWKFVSVSDA